MGLSNLSNMVRGDEVVNALAKVKSFIPADKANDIEIKINQICVDLSPWSGNKNIQPYLQMIKAALEDYKLLSFEYIAHHGNMMFFSALEISVSVLSLYISAQR